VDHGVGELTVTHAVARPRLLQEVRRIAHRLHATGDDDLGVAEQDALRAERDGEEIYVWIILSFAVGLNLNFKVRAARREITEVTRALALATAREPGPPRAVRDSAVVDRGADDEDEVAPEHRQSPERGGAA
jgi:hypothetical protein